MTIQGGQMVIFCPFLALRLIGFGTTHYSQIKSMSCFRETLVTKKLWHGGPHLFGMG